MTEVQVPERPKTAWIKMEDGSWQERTLYPREEPVWWTTRNKYIKLNEMHFDHLTRALANELGNRALGKRTGPRVDSWIEWLEYEIARRRALADEFDV